MTMMSLFRSIPVIHAASPGGRSDTRLNQSFPGFHPFRTIATFGALQASLLMEMVLFLRCMSWGRKRPSVRGVLDRSGWSTRVAVLSILCFSAFSLVVAGQPEISSELPSLTGDRVAAGGWWPTKATAHVDAFVGDSACSQCHSQEASTQADTAMAKAAFRLTGGTKSGEPASGKFENGPYSYQFLAQNPGFSLEVRSGGQSIS